MLKRQFILWSKQLPTWKYKLNLINTPLFYFLFISFSFLCQLGQCQKKISLHEIINSSQIPVCCPRCDWLLKSIFQILRIQKKENKQPTTGISEINGQVKNSQNEWKLYTLRNTVCLSSVWVFECPWFRVNPVRLLLAQVNLNYKKALELDQAFKEEKNIYYGRKHFIVIYIISILKMIKSLYPQIGV